MIITFAQPLGPTNDELSDGDVLRSASTRTTGSAFNATEETNWVGNCKNVAHPIRS